MRKRIFYGFMVFMVLAYSVVFFLRIKFEGCSRKIMLNIEKWYVIIDGFTILVSIFMFLIYCRKYVYEKKMKVFYLSSGTSK